MKKKDLIKRLSQLETEYDQLFSEISQLDHLLKKVGFAGGLVAFKETAEEIRGTQKSEN